MKKVMSAVMALSLAIAGSTAIAGGDASAGKAKSMTCAGCHGASGISPNDLWPNLAGQKAGYLAKQIKAFRDGSRQDPMMTAMVKPLSDDDIENLAAYYASLK